MSKIQFKSDNTVTSCSVAHGEYGRNFQRSEQPFAFVDEELERKIFANHPYLEIVEEGEKKKTVSEPLVIAPIASVPPENNETPRRN